MNNPPLVSVIIPFYNTPEPFFKEAVESVFAQEYSNWEVLLVDDGSQNKSTEIAKTYAKDFTNKVYYLEHENHQNLGHSASRNLGIQSSKGKFITFLDSDDVWLPNKLEQQLAIMKNHPDAGMSYGRTQYWWSWTGNSSDLAKDRIQEHAVRTDIIFSPPKLLILFLRGKTAIPCINSIMVRREVVEHIVGFEQDFSVLYGDQAFYAKICLEYPVFVSSGYWDKYRQHPDSICAVTQNAGQTPVWHMKYLKWLDEYLVQRGFKSTEIWQTLQTEIWLRRHWGLGRRIKRVQRFLGRIKGDYPLCVKD